MGSWITGLVLSVVIFGSVAEAAQSYRLKAGLSWYINEQSLARSVTNNCTNDLFIPTKTSTEWSTFVAHPPACVTIATTDPCAGTPAAGSVCQDGMIYVGTVGANKVEATPAGCTNSSTPTCDYTSADTVTKKWAADGTNPGASSTTDSAANTAAILATDSVTDSGAKYCNSLVYGGYSDWQLPARNVLALIAAARANIVGLNLTINYWSSTQGGANTSAISYDMTDGGVADRGRGYSFGVRCVRTY